MQTYPELSKQNLDTNKSVASSNLFIGKKLWLLLSFFVFFALSQITTAWAYTEPDAASKFKFLYDVAVNDFWASVSILVGLILFIAGVVTFAFNIFGARDKASGVVACGGAVLAGALLAGAVGYVQKLGCLAF